MSAGASAVVTGTHGRDPRSGARRTLPQLLLARAAEHGEAPFLRTKRRGIWHSVSWRQFAEDVQIMAHALRRRGLGTGDVIALIGENRPEVYLIEYAAQCIGASVTFLYPDASAPELDYILTNSAARMLFAQDQEQVDKALALGPALSRLDAVVYLEARGLSGYGDARLLAFDALQDSGRQPSADEARALQQSIASASDESIAALCYTSGTTSRPKGVVLTHRALLDNAYRMMASLDIPPGIRYLSYVSPAWGLEQMCGLGLGLLAPMVVHFSEKASTVQADLREIGAQFLLFTPRQWEMTASGFAAAMLNAGPLRQRLVDWALAVGARAGEARGGWRLWLAERLVLRAIRDNLGLKQVLVALSGGSGMSADVFRRFRAMGVPLRSLYGYSEYGFVSAHWGGSFDPLTLGRLLQVDAAVGEPLQAQVGADGQLRMRGGSGVSGYFRDPEATAATMDDGWNLSGDAIRLDAAGEFVFLDRVKDLRHLAGGRSYPPQFIESQLRASPYIRDAIAIGDASRPHVTVLVNIDQQIVGRYAEGRGLAWSTFADLSQHPEVHELIRQTLVGINAQLDLHARAVSFASFPKELDADDDELTRSRKLRREVIEQRYAELIGAMYEGRDDCPVEVLVRYRDGTEARLQQRVRITRAA